MTLWALAGWLGNACFFSRVLVQWVLSERARASVAPRVFWYLSLVGTLLLGAYAAERGEIVLLVGFLITGAIYTRNLVLTRRAGSAPSLSAWTTTALAAFASAALIAAGILHQRSGTETRLTWTVCAVAGQAVWSSRFVVQWWCSERESQSHFPRAFWWLSLGGNLLLLAYALHLRDAVFVAGYLPGPLVQVRNLMLGRPGSPNGPGHAPSEGLARSPG